MFWMERKISFLYCCLVYKEERKLVYFNITILPLYYVFKFLACKGGFVIQNPHQGRKSFPLSFPSILEGLHFDGPHSFFCFSSTPFSVLPNNTFSYSLHFSIVGPYCI